MRSILGECTGNVRSTPTPKDCLRTVKVSRAPWPWRLSTTPSNTWVRRRVPSTTWKCTRTRSPDENLGTRRSCSRSRFSITVLMAKNSRAALAGSGATLRDGSSGFVPAAALLEPPFAYALVVPRQQHVGDLPAPVFGRPGVVRILGRPLERRAETLLHRRLLVPERAGELAQDCVHEHHRRQLSPRQHVAPNRDGIRGQVLDHSL